MSTTDTDVIDGQEDGELYEFPLSPAQAALWFINQFSPDTPAYNIPICVRMAGEVNIEALQKSLDYLVQRHEILRTFYGSNGHEAVQYVRPDGGCPLAVENISGLDSSDMEKALSEKLAASAASPFDLQSGTVLRANLFVLSTVESCLLISVHHIAVDHSAIEHYIRELKAAYSSYIKGEEPDFPEQELQYADYVVWLKENASSTEITSKIKTWESRLKNFSGILNLPLDAPRPAVSSMRGAQYRFDLDVDTSAAVKNYSRGKSVSLYLCLLSAFKVLLHRYCLQDDIIVGTPFANRGDQEELEAVIGCFINTLPLATDFSQVSDFSSLIDSVKEVMLEAYDNQSVPLESIVEVLNPRRDQSYNPLFQVGFVFQAPPVDLDFPGIECTTVPLHSGGAMYDLHVWMWEEGDKLAGLIWYNTDIYTEESIARMAGNLQALLASIIANPAADVRQLALLTNTELQQLNERNNTQAPWPSGASLPELIDATAKRFPEKIAVINGDQELTYAELEWRSSQLANYLVVQGVKPNDFVGICLDRSVDLLVGLLGILKVGAAYVPLDPDYPNDRLLYMLEQSGVALLLTQSSLLTSLPEYSCQKVAMDDDWAKVSSCEQQVLIGPTADSLMYVIFTSGSTGLPKGVQVPHSSVVNFLTTMAARPGLAAEDKLVAVTTLSFDIAVLELYLPLLQGATVVVAKREEVSDGHLLAELLERSSASVMQATPSTWRLLLAAGWKGGKAFKALCGGEAFPRDLAGELLSRCGEVWNMYGPTETTVWSTCYQIVDSDAPIFIGQPIGNTQCYVVNEHMQRQPIGVAGELYIGGDGVTSGYLGRQDLTEERFIDDIYRPEIAGAKLYRTGDLARWRSDGNLEYLDRIDNQVKVRGFRIELEEIEHTLLKLDNIAQCAVVVREYNELDKRLVGYVQFSSNEHMTSSEVRRYLREHLPDYMVLQHLVELDDMPLTPNGKIDRKSLPDPFYNLDRSQAESYIAPTNDTQKALAKIWCEAIGVDKVSIDSYFFDSGGHSLLALEVIYRIEKDFGVKLYPRDMLMNSLEKTALQLAPAEVDLSMAPEEIDEVGAPDSKKKGLISRIFQQAKKNLK